jgi:membrane-bound lytic murein transglycosylase B
MEGLRPDTTELEAISNQPEFTQKLWQWLPHLRCGGEAWRHPRRRQAVPEAKRHRKALTPAPGGPAFLLGQNFVAAKSYNPSMAYALGLVYLGDRCTSGEPFVQAFPDS